MTSKKKGTIGFDPLAWMKESRQSSVVSRPSTPTTDDPRPTTQAVSHPPTPKTDDRRLATDDSPSAVQLGDILTIEQSAAMHAELGRHLGAKSVVLDAGSLTRVDTAGLQLLTAFIRTAEGCGARVEWRAPRPALRESARRLGLEGALRL